MTNEEMKKKIVEVLKETINWATDYSIPIGIVYKSELDKIADALIAADIGDVSEYKKHRIFIPKAVDDGCAFESGGIKQLYGNEEVEQIVKERDEYKHRAEVAERALYNLSKEFVDMQGYEKWDISILAKKIVVPDYIKQAEKELAEEGEDD